MIDVNKVKEEAEKEVREEREKKVKEQIKQLIRKREQTREVLANVERELNDAYAEIGRGSSVAAD